MRTFFQKRGWVVVAIVGIVWLALGAGDWFMRFHWFRWQQSLIWRPAQVSTGPSQPMLSVELPPVRGGDLTHLIGIKSAEEEFEDERPAALEQSDEYGYRNAPPTTNTTYPVVVVGSSYMNSGNPMTNMFAARLAGEAGVPVYNHAYPGRGPFYPLIRFLEDPRFKARPPKVLVWGIVEREIGGNAFEGMIAQVRNQSRQADEGGGHTHFDWAAFEPRWLKKSLPDTSALAQLAAKAWNRIRYAVFGQLNPDVAISTAPVEGRRFLFYYWAVTALKWTPKERNVEHVGRSLGELRDYLASRGTTLVIVLVPDKEQVYRDLLPKRLNNPASPIPRSCLLDVESLLVGEDIPVVNMLLPFEQAAAEGHMLYCRDDTHWNADAIAMAAGATWDRIRSVLEAP